MMEIDQDSSSSKQSLLVHDNKEILMPIQMSTVITLLRFTNLEQLLEPLEKDLTLELHSTNIEQLREALEKDSAFSGFIKNQAGTQLLTEHATTRNPTHKNVVEELKEGEPFIERDESENKDETIIDKHGEKSTDVGAEAMILVDREKEDTTSIDETSDDDDDDNDDDGEIDVDKAGETHIDKARHFYAPETLWRSWNPIQRYTDSKESVACIAENVANDKDLVALGVKLLKPFQNDAELASFNAQQYCETVDLFWESKNLLRAARDDLHEYTDLAKDLSYYADLYDVDEAPEDRIARIKRNPYFGRLYLEGDDPVGILRGALTILVGYWTGYDLLKKLGKRLGAPGIPGEVRVEIFLWVCGQRPDFKTYLKIIRNQI